MILTSQLRYLMRETWTIQEVTPNQIVCSSLYDPNIQIEINKIFFTNNSNGELEYKVKVSIPLQHGQYSTKFQSEMLAYEYIEDFVYDFMERGENNPFEKPIFERKFIDKGFERKRRRLSGCWFPRDTDFNYES